MLEDQFYGSRKIISVLAEQLRGPQKHGCVQIMSAGVHHARFLTAVRKPGLFRDRERIDIRAKRHTLARTLAAVDQCDDRGRYRRLDLIHADLLQFFADQLRSTEFFPSDLRVPVKGTPDLGDLLLQLLRFFIYTHLSASCLVTFCFQIS